MPLSMRMMRPFWVALSGTAKQGSKGVGGGGGSGCFYGEEFFVGNAPDKVCPTSGSSLSLS